MLPTFPLHEGETLTPDEALQKLLDRQFGLVTLHQAVGIGFSEDAIERRVRSRRLVRMHRGVFRAASAETSTKQVALAAVLACCTGTVASDETAAALLELTDVASPTIAVIAPTDCGRRPSGVLVRRADLPSKDRSQIHGIPVTSVPRTLVDVAGNLTERELTAMVDIAIRRASTTAGRLAAYSAETRFDRRRGIATLRRVVDDRLRHGVTQSVLESDMIELLREFGLPEPVRQRGTRVNGRIVRFDLLYRDPLLAIELDGRNPHSEFETWQRDHDRHNAVELGGIPTLRFTWWDVHQRRVYVACTVASGLGLRPARWKSAPRQTN